MSSLDQPTSSAPVPQQDQHFLELLEAALTGKAPLYYAGVPLALIVPFDPDYRPDLHPAGAEAIRLTAESWRNGRIPTMFVYPRGRWFVVSDDYLPLFAALTGLPDYVPCWVLGEPSSDLLRDLQGPIAPDRLRKMLGFE